jgi:hypothetical protein
MRSYCLLAAKVRTFHERGILRCFMLGIQITMRDLIASLQRKSEPFISEVFSGIICLEYRLPCALIVASWRRKSEPFISEVLSGYYILGIQITMRALIASWRRKSELFISDVFSGIICLEYRLPCALLLPPGGESQNYS